MFKCKPCTIEIVKYKPKCRVCKDSGIMKYRDIDDLQYSWVPWDTKECTFCNKEKDIITNVKLQELMKECL